MNKRTKDRVVGRVMKLIVDEIGAAISDLTTNTERAELYERIGNRCWDIARGIDGRHPHVYGESELDSRGSFIRRCTHIGCGAYEYRNEDNQK